MLKLVTGLFTSAVSAWQACLFALALGAAGGSFGTYKVMHNANLAAETKTVITQHQLTSDELKINVALGQVYVPQFVFIAAETQRIQSEVPQHVSPEIDRAYPVPLGFVRVRNEASHGPVPPAAAGGDADPSGVPLSDVARADVADEGTLDVCRAQLGEWWDWHDRNTAAWNKANGK